MKGHDGVSRVSDQQYLASGVKRRRANSTELALGMGVKLLHEVRDQGSRVRKLAQKEFSRAVPRCQGGEATLSPTSEKQGRRKASIRVWQCDQHEPAAWPDMQCVGRKCGFAGYRRDGQLLVVVVEKFLAHRHLRPESQAGANGRSRAVRGDGRRQGHFVFHACDSVPETQHVARGIRAETSLIELDGYGGVP